MDNYEKIWIWFRPETLEVLDHIRAENQLATIDGAIIWLIYRWAEENLSESGEGDRAISPKCHFG